MRPNRGAGDRESADRPAISSKRQTPEKAARANQKRASWELALPRTATPEPTTTPSPTATAAFLDLGGLIRNWLTLSGFRCQPKAQVFDVGFCFPDFLRPRARDPSRRSESQSRSPFGRLYR